MAQKSHFLSTIIGLVTTVALLVCTAPLVLAASVYNVNETTGTVGVSGIFELEYTVDTSQQTWANGDILTITVPGNFSAGGLSLTAEYDSDTNNDGSGEIAISAGPGNGQYSISGGNTINIKWSLAGWGAVANNASTIRVLLTATPSYEGTSSNFVFGGLTANVGDTNPSGSDTVNVTAADANGSMVLSTNSVVGVSGNSTLTLTLPVRLVLGDTVQFTAPSNLNVSGAAFVSENFTGTGTFASCSGLAQNITCTANGIVDPGTGNIVISGVLSRYAKTGQTISNLDVRDTSANASKARDASVSLTDTTVGALSAGSVVPSQTIYSTRSPSLVSFTSTMAIPTGGKISVTYPAGWLIFQADGSLAVETTMNGLWSVAVSGQTATLTQIGGSPTPAGSVQFMIPQIVTPSSASGGTFTISTFTSADESIQTQNGIAESAMNTSVILPPVDVGMPSAFQVTDDGAGGVLLTWEDPVGDETKNVLVFKYNPNGANTGYLIATVAKGTGRYVDSNVKEGEMVYYYLRAEAKRGIGTQTDLVSFVVGSTVNSIDEQPEETNGSPNGENVPEEEEEEIEETPPVGPVSLFNDVDESLLEPVNYLAEMEVIEGNPDGTFAPDRELNNAEAAALVVRLIEGEKTSEDNPYTDVPEDAWYKDYALSLHEEGLVNEKTFEPEEAVETQELIIWLRAFLPDGREQIKSVCKEMDCNSKDPLTRGEAVELIYQILE